MTLFFYGFTHETPKGNVLRIERYAEKFSVPMWMVTLTRRNGTGIPLVTQLKRKPDKRQLARYSEMVDANYSPK